MRASINNNISFLAHGHTADIVGYFAFFRIQLHQLFIQFLSSSEGDEGIELRHECTNWRDADMGWSGQELVSVVDVGVSFNGGMCVGCAVAEHAIDTDFQTLKYTDISVHF